MLTTLLAASLIGQTAAPKMIPFRPGLAQRVLVVTNVRVPEGQEIADYYMQKRKVPAANLLKVNTSWIPQTSQEGLAKEIIAPIRAKIKSLNGKIDFILFTKGMPYWIDDHYRNSVDALVAGMDLTFETIKKPEPDEFRRAISPYFNQDAMFSPERYKMYLVTRLDGYNFAEAKRLIDLSMSAKPSKGPFLIDGDPSKPRTGFTNLPIAMEQANGILKGRGFNVEFDETRTFQSSPKPLAGYVSWGSNDPAYKESIYQGLRFQPGAIAETFVSTSGRTFNELKPNTGQSLIADLIRAGVTGVKGYVHEPYSIALARPDILFDRYTRGYTLAESFYMASPLAKWKDVVIGDPLCAPYAKKP